MLNRSDLWSLEEYAARRGEFRAEVIKHKKDRQILIGDHLLLIFEDKLTIRYQIQEMLRIERVFEPEGIQDELDAYNPLIPDGDNFKCSLLIQYGDVEERRRRLTELVGIEDKIWLEFGDTGKVFAIADEDMARDEPGKTSAVHFLRYQLNAEQIAAAKSGASFTIGVDHPGFQVDDITVAEDIRSSIVGDLR
ncbi:MAG TPA: DUF3501 family protein [Pseudomonadales bacterium]|nr:DUF3501 family protein [Pseudomonadales bacterium]